MESKKFTGVMASLVVFMIYTLLTFGIYTDRTLEGDINNHVLSSEMFGLPAEIKDRGIEPLYHGEGVTGWDGQFYYYMSNDILGLKDTPEHIDAPAYRYQRIGLSLYTAVVAKITGQDWVSPTTFFVSYFILIVLATLVGAQLFQKIGIPPVLILLWSLSVGTQVTLFNALPDAAADAFLILAIAAVYSNRYMLSIIPFALSTLSREIYVLFPTILLMIIFLNLMMSDYRKTGNISFAILQSLIRWNKYYLLVIPGLIAVSWHFYVANHFGVSPSEQAHGILGAPLKAWFEYFSSGLGGNHKQFGVGFTSYAEAGSLLLFMLISLSLVFVSLNIILKVDTNVHLVKSLAITCLFFVILYSCFGPAVMMHYTGYFKAISLFFFLLPILLHFSNVPRSWQFLFLTALLAGLIYTTLYNMKVRMLPYGGHDKYTLMSQVRGNEEIACFETSNVAITVNDISLVQKGLLSSLIGENQKAIINLNLTNLSNNMFLSTRNKGSVHMSYHWLDQKGQVIQDGIRSAIPTVIKPGETKQINVVTPIPEKNGTYHLQLSPVQEGCSWFYQQDSSLKNVFKLTITN